jgi:hypothetical protein
MPIYLIQHGLLRVLFVEGMSLSDIKISLSAIVRRRVLTAWYKNLHIIYYPKTYERNYLIATASSLFIIFRTCDPNYLITQDIH